MRNIHDLEIDAPCQESWDAMPGDDTRRFCGRCARHVTDLSALTEEDARRVVEQGGCVRFTRDSRTRRIRFATTRRTRLLAFAALFVGSQAAAAESPVPAEVSWLDAIRAWWSPPSPPDARPEAPPPDPVPSHESAVMGGIPTQLFSVSVAGPAGHILFVDGQRVGPLPQTLDASSDWIRVEIEDPTTGKRISRHIDPTVSSRIQVVDGQIVPPTRER